MRDKFERKTFKLLIGGSTASNACSMQGYKNDIWYVIYCENR